MVKDQEKLGYGVYPRRQFIAIAICVGDDSTDAGFKNNENIPCYKKEERRVILCKLWTISNYLKRMEGEQTAIYMQ